jgi:thiamine biosynthesis lipoprotein
MNLRRAFLLVVGLLLIAAGLTSTHRHGAGMPLAGPEQAEAPRPPYGQPGQTQAGQAEAGQPQAGQEQAGPAPDRVDVTRSMMSTWVRIVAYGPDLAAVARTVDRTFARMSELEHVLSRFDPESDVSHVNAAPAGTPVAVGEDAWRVLEAAEVAWKRTGGVFDVTVGPLVNLWREAGQRGTLPTEEELARVRAAVGFDKLRLAPGLGRARQVTLTVPGMSIDLGGIAKGYIVDQAILFLASEGVTSALVAGGGDIRVLGRRGDGRPWVTAVRNPATENGEPFVTLLALADASVLTSGNYARYVTIGGRRYSHIVNPRTGWPESEVTSATVIGPDATSTDPLATALTILGPEEGVKLIESLPGYECLIVTGDKDNLRLARSRGFSRYEVAPGPPGEGK